MTDPNDTIPDWFRSNADLTDAELLSRQDQLRRDLNNYGPSESLEGQLQGVESEMLRRMFKRSMAKFDPDKAPDVEGANARSD